MTNAILLLAVLFNLNVDWKFAKCTGQPKDKDEAVAWFSQGGKSVLAPDFDDSAWEMVSIPHPVNAHDSYDGRSVDAGEVSQFRGWMAYRKTFVKPMDGAKFFLEFETVRQSIYVYVNGKYCGGYEIGTAPTAYDVTDAMKDGENLITVITENTAMRGTKYYMQSIHWNGADFNPVQGGLVGNVTLNVKKNPSYITLPYYATLKTTGVYVWADDFEIDENRGGSATVHVEAEMVGEGDIEFEVNGQHVKGGAGKIKNLVFWDPDHPHLYDVTVKMVKGGKVLDEVVVTTGFRKVEYDKDRGLIINGKPFWLPGYAQRSTDSWAAIGIPPEWMQDYDANLIRRSGANFIRWMHISPKPAPVRACDKAGVVNVCPAGDKENETHGEAWEWRVMAMEAALVYFRNSPSIIFWEAGNNQISGEHMRQMRLLKEKFDPHGYRFMGCRTISKPEQIAEAEYVGTMIYRHDDAAFKSMQQLNRYLPMMETEYCRDESAGRLWDRYTPPDFDFVCTRLASGAKQTGYNCYDETQEDFALANGSLGGGYPYFYGNRASGNGKKYYAACAMLCWTDCNQHGRNSNTENCRSSGRVDAVRLPKENFYVHQVMYAQKPKIKILGHWNYPKLTDGNYWYREKIKTPDGKEIAPIGERKQRDPLHKDVIVFASLQCASVELFVNGKSKGKCEKPTGMFDFHFPDINVTEAGYVEAKAYDEKGNIIATDRIDTAGEAAKMTMKVQTGPQGLLADGADIAFVTLKMLDANGTQLPLCCDKITFTLEGDAKFMGGWNSGTMDEKSPIGKDWVNFENGMTRVFIKAGRTAGKIKLTATCGKFTETVVIEQKPVVVEGGILKTPVQSLPRNTIDYEVKNAVAPIRDLGDCVAGGVSSKAQKYKVFINGEELKFPRRGAFKPDDSTGVCGSIEPILKALKDAGANFEYEYNNRKVRPKLRKFCPNPGKPYFPNMTIKSKGKTADLIGGVTVIFLDNGAEKNLTNYEFAKDKTDFIGELGPVLDLIDGITVEVDEAKHRVYIKVK